MKNSVKAALAALAGGGLLLGGAGSLAYWSDDESEPSQTLVSGKLDLSAPDCGTGWTDGTATNLDLTTFRLVPGDTLTKSCDFTVDALGDNLSTELTFVKPALDGNTLATELTYGATYALNGGATADLATYDNLNPTLVDLSDGDVVTVAFSVTLPFQNGVVDNDSNSGAEFLGGGETGVVAGELTAVLSQLTLTFAQVP
jgi:alternate signal-mediated exported protein